MQPTTILSNGTRAVTYESIQQIIEDCEKSLYNRFPSNLDDNFVGEYLPTFDSAVSKTKSVWKKGIDTIQKFVDRLSSCCLPEVKSRVRKIRFNEDNGDELDLDRLRSGQAYWRDAKREETTGEQTVTIMIEIQCPSVTAHENVLWRGAAAIALNKVLEDRGYRCEVWLIDNGDNNGRFINGCCLKRTADVLDISSLSSAISAWFYRTLGFNISLTQSKKWNKPINCGIYSCCTARPVELDHFSKDENRIFVAGVFSFDAAAALVEAELSKLSHY